MDRPRARASFASYVNSYDLSNPRIALKLGHTKRVAGLCERIAGAIGMDEWDVGLAWLLGLLHDIGRFEQVRRYDSFDDAATVSHAALGVAALFDEPDDRGRPLIRSFVETDAHDQLIRTTIASHSGLRLDAGLDPRTRRFCELLRDADKIDIVRVNCICPIEDIYGVSEAEMRASRLSPECVELFYQHRCLPRGVRRHPADIMLGHICFAWELALPPSLGELRAQGQLARMLSRSWDVPETRDAFGRMAAHMRRELGVQAARTAPVMTGGPA